MLVLDVGIGLAASGIFITAMSGVGHVEAGLVSGLTTTAHEIGIALVLATLSSVAFGGALASLGPRRWRPASPTRFAARQRSPWPRACSPWSVCAVPTWPPGRTRLSRTDTSSAMPAGPSRRADAQRSIAAILDAAIDLLAERPDASMADVAAAAGVARQTAYARYESRAALLSAVAGRALEQTLAALDAAAPEDGPPRRGARTG